MNQPSAGGAGVALRAGCVTWATLATTDRTGGGDTMTSSTMSFPVPRRQGIAALHKREDAVFLFLADGDTPRS
jgi:hypothetical protein